MEELIHQLQDRCKSCAEHCDHPRLKEEYQQILRFIDELEGMIKFAQRLGQLLANDKLVFVSIGEDGEYKPISTVEALSKIEQYDMKAIFAEKFRERGRW